MSESFRLSNIVPHDKYMNRNGAWRRAEDFEYEVSKRSKEIFIVSGPIVSKTSKKIGPNKVCIPDSMFKILYHPEKRIGFAFIIPNHKERKKYHTYATSINEVEKVTGINFFHELDDSFEEIVESMNDLRPWNFEGTEQIAENQVVENNLVKEVVESLFVRIVLGHILVYMLPLTTLRTPIISWFCNLDGIGEGNKVREFGIRMLWF